MGRNQVEGCDEDHEDSTFFSTGEHLLSRREGPEGSLYVTFKIRGRHSVYALLISLTSILRAMFRKKSPVQIIFERYHENLKRVDSRIKVSIQSAAAIPHSKIAETFGTPQSMTYNSLFSSKVHSEALIRR
jgi:hypothetical protein